MHFVWHLASYFYNFRWNLHEALNCYQKEKPWFHELYLSDYVDVFFQCFDVIFQHFGWVFKGNIYFRLSNFLFNYLPTRKPHSNGVFFRRTVGIFTTIRWRTKFHITNSFRWLTKWTFFKHTVALVRFATKFFYTVSCGLIGNFSLKIFFRLFSPFEKREEFSHIFHKHDVSGILELNTYSLQSLRKLQDFETLYRILPQMILHCRHYFLR